MMTSSQIRQSFLDFFKAKQHTIVPSSSLMPDSPNLLFTNAGMNQFVPIFLGQTKCPYTPGRAADTQKCIRAGGKHNDLDDVGLDTYHHTFFEMLGNWSFGDYFKKEAIEWAWELVVEKWKFPPSRLYATVYKPGPDEPSELDQEAYGHWERLFNSVNLDPKVHICYGGKKDNFWMMGETGPCGPCSELHMDLMPDGKTEGKLVNAGDARCIEIWNLVFIQFNANPDGTFSPLPAKHVDTGMGFERVTSIIQGTKGLKDFANAKISNYETDIFRPIFDALEKLSGKDYVSTLPTTAGSTGDPPTGMEGNASLQSGVGSPANVPLPSAGLVAQRHGQVARSTQAASGATCSRRNLPHFEKPWAIYHIIISTIAPRKLSPSARDIVFDCILHWRESRYQLAAACVMPDHTHFIIQPGVKEEDKDGNPVFWPLSDILHSIKSYSAKEINKLDHCTGTLWQEERYDRHMRGDRDLQEKFHYLCRNPWTGGLVKEDEPWPWLWTPDIEAWKPYVPLNKRKSGTGVSPVTLGGTGDSPVPVGDPPTGREDNTSLQSGVGSPANVPLPSTGLVAQRHGQVARATQEQIQLDIAFRVIADHIRTLSFAIADGIQPGNTDRNYVLRRILRRAVRYGRTLGFHEPFFYKLVDVLADTMGDVFPEIRAKKNHVRDVIRIEEEAFNKTLDNGLAIFQSFLDFAGDIKSYASSLVPRVKEIQTELDLINETNAKSFSEKFLKIGEDLRGKYKSYDPSLFTESIGNNLILVMADFTANYPGEIKEWQTRWKRDEKLLAGIRKDVNDSLTELGKLEASEIEIPAVFAFKLYDTYGFPLDLTELMARERGLTVDKEGFEKLMDEQKKRSQAAQKKEIISLSQIETTTPTTFVGFDKLETQAKVLEVVSLKDKTAVILDTSACYAEMGGQVGDTGELTGGGQLWRITNTQKSGNTWLHFIEAESPGDADPSRGAHAPSRVSDRAFAVGSDARHRASSGGTTEPTYTRRNLPHFDRPWAKYMVTFSTRERRKLTAPERDLALKSILYAHDHHQYQLYAACVMPDHVHLLFEPQIKATDKNDKTIFWSLSEILQGIKSASAHNINKALGQSGHVWEQESMDRMVRGQSDLEEKFHYICRNPWDSGLVDVTENYPWLWTPDASEPRAEARVGAVDEASTATREARVLPVAEPPVLPITGSTVTLSVDRERRFAIQRHHTVTHLFHWALHEVVSKEASQKGSFVGPDKLTFDFNSAPLTPAQVADIEKLVNERILENAGVSWTEVAYADVKSRRDVMQFFGDKYGDTVRVVQIGGHAGKLDGYSMELCGGTHTRATGEIGLFRIVGESAIAAGVRRIEAVAGLTAYDVMKHDRELIKDVAGRVNSPVHELDKKIEALLAQQKELERQVKLAMQRNASNAASELLERIHKVKDVPMIAHNLGDADGDFLQAIADSLKTRFQGVVVLGGVSNGAVALVATVSPDYVKQVQAGKLIQQIAPIVGGKGGGRPDNARGGGKDAGKLDEALAKAKSLLG